MPRSSGETVCCESLDPRINWRCAGRDFKLTRTIAELEKLGQSDLLPGVTCLEIREEANGSNRLGVLVDKCQEVRVDTCLAGQHDKVAPGFRAP